LTKLANKRIRRNADFSAYIAAANQDIIDLKNRNKLSSVADSSITGDKLSSTVQLITNSIQSGDYIPGEVGWSINGYGTAEFANVFVRGNINAETGTIGYWNISNPAVERYVGSSRLFGTFLESSDFGATDKNITSGTYVGLFKSYTDTPTAITDVYRENNVATITCPNHTYQLGDYVFVSVTTNTSLNSPTSFRIISVSSDTISFVSSGSNIGDVLTKTPVDDTGYVSLSNKDIAGLYIRDYGKQILDYGYFSTEGIAYSSASPVNYVLNPSFETGVTSVYNTANWSFAGTSGSSGRVYEGFDFKGQVLTYASHSTYGLSYSSANTAFDSSYYAKVAIDYESAVSNGHLAAGKNMYLSGDLYFENVFEGQGPLVQSVTANATTLVVTTTATYTNINNGDIVYLDLSLLDSNSVDFATGSDAKDTTHTVLSSPTNRIIWLDNTRNVAPTGSLAVGAKTYSDGTDRPKAIYRKNLGQKVSALEAIYKTADITNVTGNGTTVTYTAANTFAANDVVSITGVYPAVYNLTDVKIATANGTTFTITNSATGTFISGSSDTPTATVSQLKMTATNHRFTTGDKVYLDFSALDVDQFDQYWTINYLSPYFRIFKIYNIVGSTIYLKNGKNRQPSTSSLTIYNRSSSGVSRPIAAYKIVDAAYNLRNLKIEFSNGATTAIENVVSATTLSAWANTAQPYNEYCFNDIEGNFDSNLALTGASSYTFDPIEVDSSKLMSQYQSLDATGYTAASPIYLRVYPYLYENSYTESLSPIQTVSSSIYTTPSSTQFVGLTLDNFMFSSQTQFFYGDTSSSSLSNSLTSLSAWSGTPGASYSIYTPKKWIDINLDTQKATMSYMDAISYTPNSGQPLISNPVVGTLTSLSALDIYGNMFSSYGTSKASAITFNKSFGDYSSLIASSGKYKLSVFDGSWTTESKTQHIASDSAVGYDIVASKVYARSSDGTDPDSLSRIASAGVWVDSSNQATFDVLADKTVFRDYQDNPSFSTGYTIDNRKTLIDNDPDTAIHAGHMFSSDNSTTTSTTMGNGSVSLSGYFRTPASGASMIYFSLRGLSSASSGSIYGSIRIRDGLDSNGSVTSSGTVRREASTTNSAQCTGTVASTAASMFMFIGQPNTLYRIIFLISSNSAANTATAADRMIAIVPIS
jgi:hypothetical protein